MRTCTWKSIIYPGSGPWWLIGTGGTHFLWQVLVGYRTNSTGALAPVHLPIAYTLHIFSSQTLTSKLGLLWLGRQPAKLPVKSPAAQHPRSSSRRAERVIRVTREQIIREEDRRSVLSGGGGGGGESCHLGTRLKPQTGLGSWGFPLLWKVRASPFLPIFKHTPLYQSFCTYLCKRYNRCASMVA